MEEPQELLLQASGFIREGVEVDDTQAVIDEFHMILTGVTNSYKIEQIKELFSEVQITAAQLESEPTMDYFTRGALIRLNRRRLAQAKIMFKLI